jgi:glycerol-3-phosphate O-acyltransferase 1/2
MVDIIQNRMQEAWRNPINPFNEDPNQQNTFNGFSENGIIRRLGDQYKRRKQVAKENERKEREKSLYQIKEQPVSNVCPPNKAIHGLSCKYCSPNNSVSVFDKE